MGPGGRKACPGVPESDFWPPTNASTPLKKFIKLRFLVGSESGSERKFGPAERREIRNRRGRVPGRKNRREWAEAPSDAQKISI